MRRKSGSSSTKVVVERDVTLPDLDQFEAIPGLGVRAMLAATGLVYPIWAMAAMAISVTAIFLNSLRGSPRLFFDAVLSVGRASLPAGV